MSELHPEDDVGQSGHATPYDDVAWWWVAFAREDSIAVAVCEAGREPNRFVGTLGPDVQGVLKTLRRYGPAQQVSVVYEAGPTGYGLHRALSQRGYHCEIIAPSLIPRRAGERIKTDRRDCAWLAKLSRAGEFKAIWVPDEAHEAMCNLWRALEDAVNMRLKVRQQPRRPLRLNRRAPTDFSSWLMRRLPVEAS